MQAEFYWVYKNYYAIQHSHVYVCTQTTKNNDNNGSVAYAPLDLTLTLMRAITFYSIADICYVHISMICTNAWFDPKIK